MPDIFISYARSDQTERGRIQPIVAELEAAGYDVFQDVAVLPGESWANVLQDKIELARCVVVLWSERSVTSDWVREEASLAKDAGKLVPVFIDPVKAPFGFSLIQGADLSTWDGSATHPSWRNLQEVLERRLGRPAEIAAAPSTPRRRSKRTIAWAAGAIVATTLVGIAITVRPSPHDPDHEQRLEPVETSQNPAKVSPESSAPSAVDAPAPPVAPPPSKEGEGRKGVSKAQPIAPVSKDLAQLLSQAQSALARDHVDEAERLARKALSEQSGSAAAYVVLAKTHCHRRDLGSVNAMMRNLNAADRRSVRVYCESRGFSLPR